MYYLMNIALKRAPPIEVENCSYGNYIILAATFFILPKRVLLRLELNELKNFYLIKNFTIKYTDVTNRATILKQKKISK